jgi:hypothetical protein
MSNTAQGHSGGMERKPQLLSSTFFSFGHSSCLSEQMQSFGEAYQSSKLQLIQLQNGGLDFAISKVFASSSSF